MSDDLINDDQQDDSQQDDQQNQQVDKKPARSDNRFKDLSEKVELTAKERDEATAAKLAAEKELDFYKTFSKVSSKPEYQAASEYQDKIKEKVLSGYDMEDATISVLGKAGKLGNFAPPVKRDSPAGGSASTAIQSGDDKPVNEMTTAEKRAKLMDIERTDPGALTQTLRSINL